MKYYYYSDFKKIISKNFPFLDNRTSVEDIINKYDFKSFYVHRGQIILTDSQLNKFFNNETLDANFFYTKMKERTKLQKRKFSFYSYEDFKNQKKIISSKIKLIQKEAKELESKQLKLIEKGIVPEGRKKRFNHQIKSSILGANVIAALDCEFLTRSAGEFLITEVGIIKYNISTGETNVCHFVYQFEFDGKIQVNQKRFLSLIKAKVYKSKEKLSKDVNDFLSDVDLIVGHALHNDIEVLKINNIYHNKIKCVDIQKLNYYKFHKYISLSDLSLRYNVDISMISLDNDIIERVLNILDFNDENKSYIKKRSYNYNDIFLHNAFNDAFITLNNYKNMLKFATNNSPLEYLDFDLFLKKQSKFYYDNIKEFLRLNNG